MSAPALMFAAPRPAVRRPRLVHVVGYAIRGGCETCCHVFIQHEPAYEHHVVVLGEPGPMTAAWQALGATTNHLNALRLDWPAFLRRLEREFAGETCTGVILWAGIRVPLVLAALARDNHPVVIHAGNPFEAGWRVRGLLWLSALAARRPGRVTIIGCSEHVARSFRHAPFYRRLPVEACLNPVPAPMANPHQPRPLAPDRRVRLGMVARLDPIKDHAALLRAFALVRERWPCAELHLAGAGPLQRALEELAASLGLGAAVRFHGSVGDVPAFLRPLDLFCYVTTPHEGMGNALAEAMAAGLPCVVNDLPVMHEVGGDAAEGAVRFAPSEPVALCAAIDAVLRDEPARHRLSAAGWTRAREVFAPRRAIGRYLAALGVAP